LACILKNEINNKYIPCLVCSVIIGICGCKKDTTVPLLSATTITDSNYDGLNSNYMYKIYATGQCTITNDGGASISSSGACWSSSPDPTVLNSPSVTSGSVEGLFEFTIGPLEEGNIYYIRAFATNKIGTGYGKTFRFGPEPGYIIYSRPSVPLQLTPKNSSIGVSIDATLDWNYYCGTDWADVRQAYPIIYTIRLDTNLIPITVIETDTIIPYGPNSHIDFNGNRTVNLSSNKLNLKLLTTYYWEIGVKDARGASQTSSIWSFTTR
jgi:hypothetical protein